MQYRKKEEKYFKHYTGLKSNQKFLQLLDFLPPNTKEERNIFYWSSKCGKNSKINTAVLFDSDVGDSHRRRGGGSRGAAVEICYIWAIFLKEQ